MEVSLDNLQYKRTFLQIDLFHILCKFQIIKKT